MNRDETRRKALAEQERLFVGKMLPEICLNLRAALNGSCDPWSADSVREVVAMLKARLDTWMPTRWRGARNNCEALIDAAVLNMVQTTVLLAEAWLAEEGSRRD